MPGRLVEWSPMEHFDLCVIGSGSGNSIIDERFSSQRVALVDAGTFGGTCLNVGCIPTKMFVVPADLAASPGKAERLGVDLSTDAVHFGAIRDRIFGRIDPISAAGLDWRRHSDNVTVFVRRARFSDPHTLLLEGTDDSDEARITADRFVIAVGSRPFRPEIPGINSPEVAGRIHTSDSIMRLPELPKRLLILGGGFVAAEFAHIFSAYGSEVTLVNRSGMVLRHMDADIARRFTELMAPRVRLRLNEIASSIGIGPDGGGLLVRTESTTGSVYEYSADVVLLATGRTPNGDSLNLSAAGVASDADGLIEVDRHQRTSADHIWALGDSCNPWQLKHVANHEARVVQHNLLHPEDLAESQRHAVPCAVFSEPQVASVGLTEQQARDSGPDHVTVQQDYSTVAYGWALEDQHHFVKLIASTDAGQLLGAHIIGPEAASLIQQLIMIVTERRSVRGLARSMYWIHPALPEVIENALLALEEKLVAG